MLLQVFMNTDVSSTTLYDKNKIRREAASSLDDGAVTKDYPLNIETARKYLNDALATEMLCVLRYRHHEILAKGIDFPQVAQEFREHAESEYGHALLLSERIDQLGGDPDFNPASFIQRSVTEYGKETDLLGMIREDLVAERVVIEVYRKLIHWFGDQDSTTRRILEKILEDEEEHANDLADLLATLPNSVHENLY